MRTILSVLLFFIGFLFSGLSSCTDVRSHTLEGKYELRGRDYSGSLIFKGTMSLSSFEKGEVKGLCKVVKVAETFSGSVNSDGPCEGKVSGKTMTLDLAPNLSDAGVVFEGSWGEGYIEGTWMIESFAGNKSFGTFKAIRQ